MADEFIVVDSVFYQYPTGDRPVLRGVNFTLRRGEFVGLVGTTGAGKTTFCQTLNGLIPHYTRGQMKGNVFIAGENTRDLTVADLSSCVGLVFQDADAQLVMSTVEEECLLGQLSQGVPRARARERGREMLDLLGIAHLADRAPQTLSGGQKQRAAIAAVMVTQPEVLVLDEATSELDAQMVHKIFSICRRLNDELGTTIILVSHESELLARHAERMVLMQDGHIILDAPTREAFREYHTFREAGVRLPQATEYALALDSALSWPTLPLTEEEVLPAVREALTPTVVAQEESMVLPGSEDTAPEPAGEPAIRVDNVRFAYREPITVLRDVDLSFQRGEFTAIIGHNGSGKSTLMRLILGLLRPSSGRVLIDGVDTRTAKVSELARKIGFIFQDPNDQLFANSVAEEIRFGLENLELPEDEIDTRVEETLEQFGLQEVRDVFPRFLARGDKQKLCIASIVAMHPQILLLDEPTTGQDHRDARQIMQLAQTLNERGITILLVTHDLINVSRYARRIVVVNDGEIIADAPTATVMSDRPLLDKCHLAPPQIVRISLELAAQGVEPAMTPEALTAATLRRLPVPRSERRGGGGR